MISFFNVIDQSEKIKSCIKLIRNINRRGLRDEDDKLGTKFKDHKIRQYFHKVDSGIYFHPEGKHIAGSLLCKDKSLGMKEDYTLVDKIKVKGVVYKMSKTGLEKIKEDITYDAEYCNIGSESGRSTITMERIKEAKEEGQFFLLFGQNKDTFTIFGLYKVMRIVPIKKYERFDYKYLLKLVKK